MRSLGLDCLSRTRVLCLRLDTCNHVTEGTIEDVVKQDEWMLLSQALYHQSQTDSTKLPNIPDLEAGH